MKRFFAFVLTLALIAGFLPVGAFAAGASYEGEITIEMAPYVYSSTSSTVPSLKLKHGDKVLVKGIDYYYRAENNNHFGTDAKLKIYGLGEYENFTKEVHYVILKRNIRDASLSVESTAPDTYQYAGFVGYPYTPQLNVRLDGNALYDVGQRAGYIALNENNVNPGTATVRAYGIGNFFGMARHNYTIGLEDDIIWVDDYPGTESQIVITPARTTFRVNDSNVLAAAYALYKVEGETATLIEEFESTQTDRFTYDFRDVFYLENQQGGEIYLLAYGWMDGFQEIHNGVITMFVPSKVPPATELKVEKVADVGDFRTQYVTYYGTDGAVELPQWSVSDSSVATILDGTVTFQKPGIVTVTGRCGDLSDSVTLSATAQDLKAGKIFHYKENTGALVYYDGYLLRKGVDYTQSVTTRGGAMVVTLTGINLFRGQLVAEFDESGQQHSFDSPCDPDCNDCDYVRDVSHTVSPDWAKDKTHHWHCCTACGEVRDRQPHTVTAEDPDTCTVCGSLNPPGDFNEDAVLGEDDAIYLLQHVLMPAQFPITQDVDFDGNGRVDEDDAIYLLQHILMPDMFPL